MDDERDAEVFGCREADLLEDVLEALADRLADYDDQADVEEEGLISHADALREIFAGELTRAEDCGSIYGWSYELYCSSMGDWLSNRNFCPCRARLFEMLDEALARGDVPLRFHRLLFEEFPIPVDTGAQPCGGCGHTGIWSRRDPLCGPSSNRPKMPTSGKPWRRSRAG